MKTLDARPGSGGILTRLVLLLMLLALPVAIAEGYDARPDPQGDQAASSILPGGRCTDTALDVVESGVTLGENLLIAYFRVADATAEAHCEPLPGFWERRVLRGFHVYTEDYPESGHYVVWVKDEVYGHQSYVALFDPQSGAYSELDVVETLEGDTYRIEVPATGTLIRSDGLLVPYHLRGPIDYYGHVEGHYSIARQGLSHLKDYFGSMLDA
ncbi:MAG TPA: hypothetical protein VNZ52_05185 [Candidatus Thermoplasmatota archaeon]|nr:hypothetical protein [Candidatus Thermoplasmatota archaeon]